jgi:hypothetical protein
MCSDSVSGSKPWSPEAVLPYPIEGRTFEPLNIIFPCLFSSQDETPEIEDDFFQFAAPFRDGLLEIEDASFWLTAERIKGGEGTFQGGMRNDTQHVFFLEGTRPFNATGHPAGQPTVRGTRARGIRNDRHPAVTSFTRSYIKLIETEALDRYLCRFSLLPSYIVFSFYLNSHSSPSRPLPLFRWQIRPPFFLLAIRGPFPSSPTRIWRRWSKPAFSTPISLARSPSGSRCTTSKC